MDKDSFIIGLLEDGFDAEDAEMIAQDLIAQFGDDPDFQDQSVIQQVLQRTFKSRLINYNEKMK